MSTRRRGLTLALAYLCVSAAAGAVGPLFSASSALLEARLVLDSWAFGQEAGLGVLSLARGDWQSRPAPAPVGLMHAPPHTPETCTVSHTESGTLQIVCADAVVAQSEAGHSRRPAGEVLAAALGVAWFEALGGPQIDADLPRRARTGVAHGMAWGTALVLAGAALHHARNGGVAQVLAARRAAEEGVDEVVEDSVEDAVERRDPAPATAPPPAVVVLSRAPFREDVPPA